MRAKTFQHIDVWPPLPIYSLFQNVHMRQLKSPRASRMWLRNSFKLDQPARWSPSLFGKEQCEKSQVCV